MARILIIDDNKDVREMIGRSLSAAGHDLEFAENGVEGLRSLKVTTPDLVVCDLLMPEKEGIGTIMEIRKLDADIPIIAISGGGRYIKENSEFLGDILDSAKMLGADYTLRKPFRPRELLDLIQMAMPGGKGAE